MRCRLVQERPEPDPEFWADAVLVWRLIMERAGAHSVVEPMSLNTWLARFGGPDSARVKILRDAYHAYERGDVPISQLRTSVTSLKGEVQTYLTNKTFELGELIKARLINEADPALKALKGMYFVPQMNFLHTTMGPATMRPIVYTCESTEEEIAMWVWDAYTKIQCIFVVDFKTFDCTNSEWSFETVKLRNIMLGLPRRIQKVHNMLTEPTKFKGRFGCVAKVKRPGTWTGDPGTSIDNTTKAMSAIITAAIVGWGEDHGFKGRPISDYIDEEECPKPGRDIFLAGHGDDSIGTVRPDLVEGLRRVLKRTGFIAKAHYNVSPPKAEFCSKALWPIENGWFCMGPLFKLLFKMGVTYCKDMCGDTRNPKQVDRMLQFRRGNALGLLKSTNFIPLLHDRVVADLELTKGVTAEKRAFRLGKAEVQKTTWIKYNTASRHDWSPESDTWACLRYGVPQWVITEMRQFIRDHSSGLPSLDTCSAWEVLLPAIAEVDAVK